MYRTCVVNILDCSKCRAATNPSIWILVRSSKIMLNLYIGFPLWKRAYFRAIAKASNTTIRFISSRAHLERVIKRCTNAKVESDVGIQVYQWGEALIKRADFERRWPHTPLITIEDGFIRSVGLGKYYLPPCSVVFDKRGIYYDAKRASDLEIQLSEVALNHTELERAEKLVERLKRKGISKYNVGCTELPAQLSNRLVELRSRGDSCKRKVILVVGQVSADLSIEHGACSIKTDLELLEQVRQRSPKDFLIYKPHPDVISGNVPRDCPNFSDLSVSEVLADFTLTDADIGACFELIDELHTITSLAGFEALLRGVSVYVYGRPFYAGWGLTDDKFPIERRERALSLQELAFVALCQYPLYFDYDIKQFISIEQVLDIIESKQSESRSRQPISAGQLSRLYLKSYNLTKSLIYGVRNRG